jgi:hypothetical protein
MKNNYTFILCSIFSFFTATGTLSAQKTMSRLPDLGINGTQKIDFGRSLNCENTNNDILFNNNF